MELRSWSETTKLVFCRAYSMEPLTITSPSWFAIRVRSRSEKVAAADLSARGFPVCAATAPHRRVWIDRIRTVQMPLFPGYIFAQFHPADRAVIQRASGVAGIVGCNGIDHPVSAQEMEPVLTLLRSGVEVFKTPYLHVGAKVRVCHGSLAGVTGELLQIKNRFRLVVSVHLLQRSVAVEVDSALVEPIQNDRVPFRTVA